MLWTNGTPWTYGVKLAEENRETGGRLSMSYVKSVLQPGENVRFATDIHWMVYLPGLLVLAVALAVYVVAWWFVAPGTLAIFLHWLGGILFAAAAILLFLGWFKRWTVEVAVTDKRIIYKHGFISRHTIEMNLDKVESVDVEQSILGRLLGYGDIYVRGVGASLEPLRNIESPIEFRNHVTAA
jgi:uncharacterized membrane protein YdbT with pleckstrin-like domain